MTAMIDGVFFMSNTGRPVEAKDILIIAVALVVAVAVARWISRT